jgi:hypothetical protein
MKSDNTIMGSACLALVRGDLGVNPFPMLSGLPRSYSKHERVPYWLLAL